MATPTIAISQCLALEKSLKATENREGGALLRACARPEPFSGQLRFYKPKDDDGEKRPSEDKKVTDSVKSKLDAFFKLFAERMNITATKDLGNTEIRVNVVVDGVTVLEQLPPTLILALKQKLEEIQGLLQGIYTLPLEDDWVLDANSGLYRSAPDERISTKKIDKVLELSPATEKHAAQVQLRPEDVTVGTWTTIKLSSAMPVPEKTALLAKVNKLISALKLALEEANQYRRQEATVGSQIAQYLGF